MNKIEKGKANLKTLGIILLAISVLTLVGGILLIVFAFGLKLNVLRLIFGILTLLFSIPCLYVGIHFTWVASSLKATKGSIAEDNLAKGTVNMKKCTNCGAEVEEGKNICAKCEENLKP